MKTQYLQHADGSISAVEVAGDGGEHVAPEGSVKLTPKQYAAHLAELEGLRDAHGQALLAGDRERILGDVEVLTGLGVPESAALRLAGYDADKLGAV